jgi:hypothetical protein
MIRISDVKTEIREHTKKGLEIRVVIGDLRGSDKGEDGPGFHGAFIEAPADAVDASAKVSKLAGPLV